MFDSVKKNGCSVQIIPGQLIKKGANNIVVLEDDTEYSIKITTNFARVIARIKIDGEDMGSFNVMYPGTILEHPANRQEKFKFKVLPVDEDEVAGDGDVSGDIGSLVSVTFVPIGDYNGGVPRRRGSRKSKSLRSFGVQDDNEIEEEKDQNDEDDEGIDDEEDEEMQHFLDGRTVPGDISYQR
eukprot:CAMPEP_0168534802 /NCGR_PEP_ID=MMETSP0405-20121227/18214_1 /TAXON_ID=498012 /ORGANISM="Trichosphaerium sp, Strain Am-I-7 wt" /LENGTH=182 /DNA_ID=CAMNT_0008561773 /DNA_START=360 /DNA_END=904 /DNA_ORIENTATION=+